MDRDNDFIPSSPTNSSLSSSDLDTESTGSFFHDRSTTLGTLMGVSFPDIAVRPERALSQLENGVGGDGGGGGEGGGRRPDQSGVPERRRRRRRRRHRGGRRWWRLCRDDMVGPTSLGDFLQVERRLDGGGEVSDDHFLYGGGGGGPTEHESLGGGPLFEDGRLLPPEEGRRRGQQQQRAAEGTVSLGRLPVLLAGICCGVDG